MHPAVSSIYNIIIISYAYNIYMYIGVAAGGPDVSGDTRILCIRPIYNIIILYTIKFYLFMKHFFIFTLRMF